MSIGLSDILRIEERGDFKIHLACWNGQDHPLDVFLRDRSEWDMWNAWRPKQDIFNRPYIFSLIDFYHEPGIWMFGGVYKVLERRPENKTHSYTVVQSELARNFIGRLKLRFNRPGRQRVLKMENYYDQFTVSEILKEIYSGREFCGFEMINHGFAELESIFRSNRPDWKGALENVKGVYLITDRSNGKRYIGSAYGEGGIWARWAEYLITGHGGNDELLKLIKKNGIQYARNNFWFALLEHYSMRSDDQTVIDRESHWKKVLLTRGDYGFNLN